jgi:phosphatidylinositol-3-phosphatase
VHQRRVRAQAQPLVGLHQRAQRRQPPQGDTWLKNNIDSYAQWAKANNSLLIVTWDENNGVPGNKIPTIIVGANVIPGTYSANINHYNVLRTIEDCYGLTPVGASASATPITDIFGG